MNKSPEEKETLKRKERMNESPDEEKKETILW